MANIKHIDVGSELSKAEWEAANSHQVTQTIADNDIVTVDGSPADNEYAKFTANGVEGRSYSELRTDINVEDGADVTDATNVAAAGAVMEADTSTASMSFVVDEDDMVSDDDTKVPTQQSVKAYVDLRLLISDIDNTPVDNETAAPISSNWAFDHDADVDAHHDKDHAASHAVGGADTVFPADPGEDKYLMWDDDPGQLVWAAAAGGASAFTDLTDVPADYDSQAGKYLAVNGTEDGIEFVDAPSSGGGAGSGECISARALLLPDGYLPYWDIDDGIVRVLPSPTQKWSGFPLLQGFTLKNSLLAVY